MGAIAHQKLSVTNEGFPYDRYWMLIDEDNTFISQRDIPELALFRPSFEKDTLVVSKGTEHIQIPLKIKEHQALKTMVWEHEVFAIEEDKKIHGWFSNHLQRDVRLVRKSNDSKRSVSGHPTTYINFADGSQFLIIGEETLNDLNARLSKPVSMSQFRPNLVFSGNKAFAEDDWLSVTIGDTAFRATKGCSRCVMITINQDTAIKDQEPLQVLSSYRKRDHKVYFGQFLKLDSANPSSIELGHKLTPVS